MRYLVAPKTLPMIYNNLKRAGILPDIDGRWSTKIAIRKVTVAECQRIHGVMAFEIGIPIIHEPSNATTLQMILSAPTIPLKNQNKRKVVPPFPRTRQ